MIRRAISVMHSQKSCLYTISEYADFIRRRWQFIVVGAISAAVVVGLVSLALPDVYSAWIVIDAGTLGARRGTEIDGFRGTFNAGGYRQAVADFLAGTISRAWMEFDPPNVVIRVDATDGPTSAAGATRVAEYAMKELAQIPVFRQEDLSSLRASAEEIAAIRTSVKELEEWAASKLADARIIEVRLIADRSRTLDDMRALDLSDIQTPKQWRSLVDRLSTIINAPDDLHRQMRDLEIAVVDLRALQDRELSQAAVPKLRSILEASPRSVEELVVMVGSLKGLAAYTPLVPPPPLVPMRVTATPQVPTTPTWPNRGLNVLIALLFGGVGSTFAAIILDRKE